jgi:transposase
VGNVCLTNLPVLNAILYVAEQGCKCRGLPKRLAAGTIYMRMNRWAKNGELDRVFGATAIGTDGAAQDRSILD